MLLNSETEAKNRCPRCHSGFLFYGGTVAGDEGVCINCGHRPPAVGATIELNRDPGRSPRLPGESRFR